MTGQTDVQPDEPLRYTNSLILIDGWPDGYVEERGWVEVATEVTTSDEAIEALERYYPVGDLEDGCGYFCDGSQEWMALDREWMEEHGKDTPDDEGPWKQADEKTEGAKLFWVVEVTDE